MQNVCPVPDIFTSYSQKKEGSENRYNPEDDKILTQIVSHAPISTCATSLDHPALFGCSYTGCLKKRTKTKRTRLNRWLFK